MEGPGVVHILLVDDGEESKRAIEVCEILGPNLRVVKEEPSSPECPCPYLIAPKGVFRTLEGIECYVETYRNLHTLVSKGG